MNEADMKRRMAEVDEAINNYAATRAALRNLIKAAKEAENTRYMLPSVKDQLAAAIRKAEQAIKN